MPFAVYVLGLAVFAQGTSEFMLSGLVTGIADDLHVSLSAAGLLTSAFAIGMVVGAPLMSLLSRRWPRRRALVAFLSVFVAVHVVGALTTSYPLLLATRVVGALANAGFWAVALATAVGMVEPGLRARAASVVVGGVTLACIAGVPGGALLGEQWGWRSAFWAVALVSLPAVLAIVRTIPEQRPDAGADEVSARRELRVLRDRRLLSTLLVCALVQGATFCTFTYLAPLVTEVTGFGEGWVPGVLALFGVGSFVGVTLGGRVIDARPMVFLTAGMVSLAAGWTAFAVTAGHPVAALVFVFVQGMLAFGTGIALISRVLEQAAEAPTLAGGFATAAFNVGATVGPWAGGLALSAGLGFRSPVWVSALLMGLALPAVLIPAAAAASAALRGRRAAAAGGTDREDPRGGPDRRDHASAP
ncbi:MFS transporter [Streptomyces armeniacus]|uniref:MFS transporter n=1 Tax=Streptomyces armeniacus TaxID=83291 RepID=A0A345XNR6_9ACTN|nr:Cmx/CmrA family chloramphenicol efflux MFS transporter [Streptomyces armeniacus]AXK33282.1 MFS transporter [Streptomyces armeniacus]